MQIYKKLCIIYNIQDRPGNAAVKLPSKSRLRLASVCLDWLGWGVSGVFVLENIMVFNRLLNGPSSRSGNHKNTHMHTAHRYPQQQEKSLDNPRRRSVSHRGNLSTSDGCIKALQDKQEALKKKATTFMGGGGGVFSGTGTKALQFKVVWLFFSNLKAFLNMSKGSAHVH